MHVITSKKLFEKYPGHETELQGLLNQLSPNITVIPIVDYIATKQICDSINDSILIIGNDDVIPFAQLPNPATDSDATVPSDAPYSCVRDKIYLIPDKVISRIPDEELNPTWDYLSTVLKNQINWTKNKTTNQNWFHIVAQVWQSIGQYLHDAFKMDEFNPSPPNTYHNLTNVQINKKFSYINLHGTTSNGNFYNQCGETFDVALIPQEGNFNGTFVFSEACYGAMVTGRNKEGSIAMMALYSNAISFLGSTTIAYGPSAPPPACMDLFAQCFYNRILSGENLGQAFLNAKVDFSTHTIKSEGSMNGSSRKTLLQVHLYGNPDIII